MSGQEQEMKEYSQHANNVLAWLQSMNKVSKASPRQPLQQQLQSLSLSYKNAQQKLLSLEKQLYHESLHNEKQRSLIQLLKQLVSGSLDDETILSYLVEMQEESNPSVDSKFQIRGELEEIKEIMIRRKREDKRVQGMKSGAIGELKREIVRGQAVKKELMEDLDRVLNQKGALETVLEEMKGQFKVQGEEKKALQLELETLRHNQTLLVEESNRIKNQIAVKSSLLSQKQQLLQKVKTQLSKISKKPEQKIDQQQILKWLKKLQEKLQKYRKTTQQLSQNLKKQALSHELLTILKTFLPEEGVKVFEEFQRTGQKCLIKEMEAIGQLQRKKYRLLQGCQEEVWRLKERLLREGSWGKSRRTGATISADKENHEPNLPLQAPNPKISSFDLEQSDLNKP